MQCTLFTFGSVVGLIFYNYSFLLPPFLHPHPHPHQFAQIHATATHLSNDNSFTISSYSVSTVPTFPIQKNHILWRKRTPTTIRARRQWIARIHNQCCWRTPCTISILGFSTFTGSISPSRHTYPLLSIHLTNYITPWVHVWQQYHNLNRDHYPSCETREHSFVTPRIVFLDYCGNIYLRSRQKLKTPFRSTICITEVDRKRWVISPTALHPFMF